MIGFEFESAALADGYKIIAGLDEVGRGCLAGPVVASAVILDPSYKYDSELNDSKKLTRKKREIIAVEIRENALSWGIGQVEAIEIDRINILQATKKAMLLALTNLDPQPEFLLIDALELNGTPIAQKSIIKGDTKSASIAAASIVAKVYRDDLMTRYAKEYPEYSFDKHVGYGTKAHFEELRQHGATPIHRKSFRGVLPNLFGE